MNPLKIRSLFESRSQQSNGRWRFLTEMKHGLGLCDKDGNDYRDYAGNRISKDAKVRAEQFSLAELAEGIIGPSWRGLFNPDSRALNKFSQAKAILEATNPGDTRALLESTGIGIDPTAFANINTFTSVVGGLVEVKILEAFQNPALIADRVCPAEPTKLNGQKIIGVNHIGDRAAVRKPGMPHERAQFNERWVETPETVENALAVDVLKETVFFDLTGQILQMASSVGEELAYRKEIRVIDTIIGVTNSFKYNGTAYNTYVTSRTQGYLNDQSNPLLDWTSIQSAMLLFARMQDPATGKRILTKPDTIIVNPAKVATANLILSATTTERRSGGGASTPQTTSNPLNVSVSPGSPYSGLEVLSSPIIEQRCTDATGLNLSQANADDYWWALERGKSFRYMQNYPLAVNQAAPNQYEMLDKGIVASYFANERGVPSIWSPWHVVRNKN